MLFNKTLFHSSLLPSLAFSPPSHPNYIPQFPSDLPQAPPLINYIHLHHTFLRGCLAQAAFFFFFFGTFDFHISLARSSPTPPPPAKEGVDNRPLAAVAFLENTQPLCYCRSATKACTHTVSFGSCRALLHTPTTYVRFLPRSCRSCAFSRCVCRSPGVVVVLKRSIPALQIGLALGQTSLFACCA